MKKKFEIDESAIIQAEGMNKTRGGQQDSTCPQQPALTKSYCSVPLPPLPPPTPPPMPLDVPCGPR
jgi:hypothetical protein